MKTIYMGNIPFHSTERDVHALFAEYGSVESVKIVADRKTGQSRGFGFIEMKDPAAKDAIRKLDGKKFGGRFLRVLETKALESNNRD